MAFPDCTRAHAALRHLSLSYIIFRRSSKYNTRISKEGSQYSFTTNSRQRNAVDTPSNHPRKKTPKCMTSSRSQIAPIILLTSKTSTTKASSRNFQHTHTRSPRYPSLCRAISHRYPTINQLTRPGITILKNLLPNPPNTIAENPTQRHTSSQPAQPAITKRI